MENITFEEQCRELYEKYKLNKVYVITVFSHEYFSYLICSNEIYKYNECIFVKHSNIAHQNDLIFILDIDKNTTVLFSCHDSYYWACLPEDVFYILFTLFTHKKLFLDEQIFEKALTYIFGRKQKTLIDIYVSAIMTLISEKEIKTKIINFNVNDSHFETINNMYYITDTNFTQRASINEILTQFLDSIKTNRNHYFYKLFPVFETVEELIAFITRKRIDEDEDKILTLPSLLL